MFPLRFEPWTEGWKSWSEWLSSCLHPPFHAHLSRLFSLAAELGLTLPPCSSFFTAMAMNNQVIITCKKNYWFRCWAKPVITTRKLLWFNSPYSYKHSNCKITQLYSCKSWPSIFLVWGDSLSSQTSDDCTLPPPAWKLNEVWKRTGV